MLGAGRAASSFSSFQAIIPRIKGVHKQLPWGRDQEPESHGQGQAEHQSSAGTGNSHVIVSVTRIVGLFNQSQEAKLLALLLLYLEAKRPVDKVQIQVIQLQVCKSLLAGCLHQSLLMKGAPQLETKTRAHCEFLG